MLLGLIVLDTFRVVLKMVFKTNSWHYSFSVETRLSLLGDKKNFSC